jgi:hypothetical protein
MTPTYTLEMQCTHAEFLRELPAACGNRPYEIIDNEVIVYDGDRKIRFQIRDKPNRHLGSSSGRASNAKVVDSCRRRMSASSLPGQQRSIRTLTGALTAAVVRKKWRCAFRSGLSPNNQALDGTFPSEYS